MSLKPRLKRIAAKVDLIHAERMRPAIERAQALDDVLSGVRISHWWRSAWIDDPDDILRTADLEECRRIFESEGKAAARAFEHKLMRKFKDEVAPDSGESMATLMAFRLYPDEKPQKAMQLFQESLNPGRNRGT